MKIFIAQLNPIVGDLKGNVEKIKAALSRARSRKAEIVLFAELVMVGYPPEDLLLYPEFIQEVEQHLKELICETEGLFVVIGMVRKNPFKKEKSIFNSAAVICDRKLLGFKDKMLLPTYDVFDEGRYFEPGGKPRIWKYKDKRIGIFICEDMWQHSGLVEFTNYSRDPVEEMKKLKPNLVLNLSASPYYFKKNDLRLEIYKKASKTLNCLVATANQVGGNDQLIFDGYSSFIEKGKLISMARGFEEGDLVTGEDKIFKVDPYFDLYRALVVGLRDYFFKLGLKKACLGLSGGIDSSMTLCIAAEALGSENVVALYMPSRFSSKKSFEDAKALTDRLNVKLLVIPIDKLFQHYLDLLIIKGTKFDTTEENLQSRIRGMILMAFSNKYGHIVLSTGNKSEMAMGYATLYGDMCGGLGVISDVMKTEVYKLAEFINRDKEIIPLSIIKKEPSAELRKNQKDSDSLPPYEVVDLVLKAYVEEHLSSKEIIRKYKIVKKVVEELIRRIHFAEYKRRQGPLGIKVSKKSFIKGRVFPIVQKWVK